MYTDPRRATQPPLEACNRATVLFTKRRERQEVSHYSCDLQGPTPKAGRLGGLLRGVPTCTRRKCSTEWLRVLVKLVGFGCSNRVAPKPVRVWPPIPKSIGAGCHNLPLTTA